MTRGRRVSRGGALTALSISGALLWTACGDFLLPSEPGDGPVEVARAAWSEIDAYYPFFARKAIDWDSVGDQLLPRVGPETGDDELFEILADMVAALRDGHAELRAPFGRYLWRGRHEGRPENFSEDLLARYLRSPSGSASGDAIRWGTLEGGLGYLRISTFAPSSGIGEGVDRALGSLGAVPGLIIDIRSNGGGSDTETEAAAGRFIDRRAHYRTHRYKAGPGHDDFGPETRDFIEPQGRRRYDGPIAVLQNRRTFSAAEDFVLIMRVRPNVTFVGDSTGGGAGNPIGRELPNGWFLKVSRWQAWAADGTWYEGIGLAPDVPQDISPEDLAAGRDAILERATAILDGS